MAAFIMRDSCWRLKLHNLYTQWHLWQERLKFLQDNVWNCVLTQKSSTFIVLTLWAKNRGYTCTYYNYLADGWIITFESVYFVWRHVLGGAASVKYRIILIFITGTHHISINNCMISLQCIIIWLTAKQLCSNNDVIIARNVTWYFSLGCTMTKIKFFW